MLNASRVVSRGRRAIESLMVDACTVVRITSQATNDLTAAVADTTAALYAGKCRIQLQAKAHARAEDVGEDYVRLLRIEVQLPMTVTGLRTQDVITITSSALDPDLVGRKFRVRDLMHKTHATARRVLAEEVT